jgi:hypothetical protein
MNNNLTTILLTATGPVGSALTTAVTDKAIVDRTAFALGLGKVDFTVNNRVDDGTTTRYNVRTESGQDFNSFVGGSISATARTVSEAICTKKSEVARNPLLR